MAHAFCYKANFLLHAFPYALFVPRGTRFAKISGMVGFLNAPNALHNGIQLPTRAPQKAPFSEVATSLPEVRISFPSWWSVFRSTEVAVRLVLAAAPFSLNLDLIWRGARFIARERVREARKPTAEHERQVRGLPSPDCGSISPKERPVGEQLQRRSTNTMSRI